MKRTIELVALGITTGCTIITTMIIVAEHFDNDD